MPTSLSSTCILLESSDFTISYIIGGYFQLEESSDFNVNLIQNTVNYITGGFLDLEEISNFNVNLRRLGSPIIFTLIGNSYFSTNNHKYIIGGQFYNFEESTNFNIILNKTNFYHWAAALLTLI